MNIIANRRFLVTGGAGFIGSHVVDTLMNEDAASVTVLDDFNDYYDPQIKEDNIAQHLADPRFQVVRGGICDRRLVTSVFDRGQFDAVVHLAARAGVRPSLSQARLYEETNIAGTLNLFDEARRSNVQEIVFASSSSVYGEIAQPPFREDAQLAPISPYAATKAAGELIAHTYSHLYKMRIVCLRLFTVYGERQRPDLAIHKFAKLIADGEPIPVYGDGSAERDYTYIADILQGIRGALWYAHSGETLFEVINLGESRTVALSELISLLEDTLGRSALIDRRGAQPGDMPRTHADIGKARRLLGYNPTTSIRDGIERFIEWFQMRSRSGLVGAR